MILTDEDIARIEALGYKREEFTRVYKRYLYALRNVNRKCFFYREGYGCLIYEHRPLGCRAYPVVYSVDRGECVVDDYCPAAYTVTKEDIEKAKPLVMKLVSWVRKRLAKYGLEMEDLF